MAAVTGLVLQSICAMVLDSIANHTMHEFQIFHSRHPDYHFGEDCGGHAIIEMPGSHMRLDAQCVFISMTQI